MGRRVLVDFQAGDGYGHSLAAVGLPTAGRNSRVVLHVNNRCVVRRRILRSCAVDRVGQRLLCVLIAELELDGFAGVCRCQLVSADRLAIKHIVDRCIGPLHRGDLNDNLILGEVSYIGQSDACESGGTIRRASIHDELITRIHGIGVRICRKASSNLARANRFAIYEDGIANFAHVRSSNLTIRQIDPIRSRDADTYARIRLEGFHLGGNGTQLGVHLNGNITGFPSSNEGEINGGVVFGDEDLIESIGIKGGTLNFPTVDGFNEDRGRGSELGQCIAGLIGSAVNNNLRPGTLGDGERILFGLGDVDSGSLTGILLGLDGIHIDKGLGLGLGIGGLIGLDGHHVDITETVVAGIIVDEHTNIEELTGILVIVKPILEVVDALDAVTGLIGNGGHRDVHDVSPFAAVEEGLIVLLGSEVGIGVDLVAGEEVVTDNEFVLIALIEAPNVGVEDGAVTAGGFVADFMEGIEVLISLVLGLAVSEVVAVFQTGVGVDVNLTLGRTVAVGGAEGCGVTVNDAVAGVLNVGGVEAVVLDAGSSLGGIGDVLQILVNLADGQIIVAVGLTLDDHSLNGAVILDASLRSMNAAVILAGAAEVGVGDVLLGGEDFDGGDFTVIVKGDEDILHLAVLVGEAALIVGNVRAKALQRNAAVAGTQLIGQGLAVHFIIAGPNIIDAVRFGHGDFPVSGILGAALVVDQIAFVVAEGVVVLGGTDIEFDFLAVEVEAVNDIDEVTVLHGLTEAGNNHPICGAADILAQHGIAELVEEEGDILLGDLEGVLVSGVEVLVPLRNAVLGAADRQGDGAAVVSLGAVSLDMAEDAGDRLGGIGTANLIGAGLAGTVSGIRLDNDEVANLHILDEVVVVVANFHVGNLLVDGLLVVAGKGSQVVVGRAVVIHLEGDEVGTDLLDLHELALDDDNMAEDVGLALLIGDISIDLRAVIRVVGDGGGVLEVGAVGSDGFGDTVDIELGILGDLVAVHVERVELAGIRSIVQGVDHLLGEGEIRSEGILADGDALVAPLDAGASEVVDHGVILVVIEAEVHKVLLAELNGVPVGVVAVVVLVTGLDVGGEVLVAGTIGPLLGTADIDGDAGDGDGSGAGAVVFNGGGLEGIEGQLAGGFTVDGFAALEGDAVKEAGSIAEGGDAHGPAGAGEAFDIAVKAKRAEEHLGEGEAGEGTGGTEGAIIVAVDDLFRLAEADVAREDVAGGDIGVGAAGGGESLGGLGAD